MIAVHPTHRKLAEVTFMNTDAAIEEIHGILTDPECTPEIEEGR